MNILLILYLGSDVHNYVANITMNIYEKKVILVLGFIQLKKLPSDLSMWK